MEQDVTTALNPYVKIWLSLLSGAALMSVFYSYWGPISGKVESIFLSWLPEKPSRWWENVPIIIFIVVLVVTITVGSKVLNTYIVDPVLRTQLSIAGGVVIAAPTIGGIRAINKRRPPPEWADWIYVAPTLVVGAILIYLVFWGCPSDTAQLWWTPCLATSSAPMPIPVHSVSYDGGPSIGFSATCG